MNDPTIPPIKKRKKKRKGSFKRTFIAGFFIVLPILVTFWVVKFIFGQLDRAVTPAVLSALRLFGAGEWLRTVWVEFAAPLVSVILSVVFIYFLGLIGGNVLGKQLLRFVERIVLQIPVARSIYSATRQFLDTFSNSSKQAFRKVVLVEYPRKGLWTMALVTNDLYGEVQERTENDLVSVFVPTTPNPTSGWLLFVPRSDVVELDMNVDDAFKMIISGGVLIPEHKPKTTLEVSHG